MSLARQKGPAIPAQKLPNIVASTAIVRPGAEAGGSNAQPMDDREDDSRFSSEPQWKAALRRSKKEKDFESKKKAAAEAERLAAIPIWKRHIMEVKERKSSSPNGSISMTPQQVAAMQQIHDPDAPTSSAAAVSAANASWMDNLASRDTYRPTHSTNRDFSANSARFNTLERGNISALGNRHIPDAAPLVPKALQMNAQPAPAPVVSTKPKKNLSVSFFEEENEIPYVEFEGEIEFNQELATEMDTEPMNEGNADDNEDQILSTLRVAALARPDQATMALNVAGRQITTTARDEITDVTNLEDDLAAMIW
ncbi:hypothetical protein CAOG_04336 [Capsaspora owczarzaki ATCC 30864]|uniref:Uncharacterized protein n=1 Tax=Capsaspora owczarzaki (strain ATCC 30864) TaxID=595528 RepID=A0A0D2X325_CAPO3|nr:hypothetical protein CAOG_04336 [Capsaspora owczarzaki ATCC 30864]KJE93569.1 hypothetical protein CAOG_004336 [Capsaspora owczarzaki ATCC 30864]|eukprot:XP_004348164.1 hypothetical protein CAOG_04336 [Capsaspora owczarzaki ATCC 30864]